ncbi:hypothetical protein PG996_007311 [Apiospora saccharicola]|uniref:Uncharacterized protein n=1 Tax=Apiospora saccharicola TaxID=335842 RepID=A0ABR1VAG4_9PEZI
MQGKLFGRRKSAIVLDRPLPHAAVNSIEIDVRRAAEYGGRVSHVGDAAVRSQEVNVRHATARGREIKDAGHAAKVRGVLDVAAALDVVDRETPVGWLWWVRRSLMY